MITDTDTNRYKFTGKERDTESGLDMFGARYYASTMGRFMTPDWASEETAVPYADFGNPQSLNLYSYTKNNPTTLRDPDGHCDIDGEHHSGFWCFLHLIGFKETEKERQKRIENERQQLLNNARNSDGSPLSNAQRARLSGASATQIDELYKQLKQDADDRQADNDARRALGLASVVRFGNDPNQDYHAFRHIEEEGLSKADVENAIRNDLAGREDSLPQGLTNGQVTVNGKTLDYSAYKLPDGTINVGRITVR